MADDRMRRLERAANQGDREAAEQLYQERIRAFGDLIIDRLIERVMILEHRHERRDNRAFIPDVFDKLRWVSGGSAGPGGSGGPHTLEEQIALMRERSVVDREQQLSTLVPVELLRRMLRPEQIRWYAVYVRGSTSLHGLLLTGEKATWQRICSISAEPPGYPIFVVQTLAQRDALEQVIGGMSCLVLENMGFYRADLREHYGQTRTHWQSIRIETRDGH